MSKKQIVRTARKNMRLWARQWRIAKQTRDRFGARFALERSIIWRETAVTLTHNYNSKN